MSTIEAELVSCRKYLKDLQTLRTKSQGDVTKYERTRAVMKDLIGRGPITELEREELKTSIKKLNSMIEQLAQYTSAQQHNPPLKETDHSNLEKKVKESYKSVLSATALFKAIFK